MDPPHTRSKNKREYMYRRSHTTNRSSRASPPSSRFKKLFN
jgi:hypothetical protein